MYKIIEQLKETVRADAERIEKELDAYLTCKDEKIERFFEAQRYSVLDGGKRVRPFIVNEFCRLFGGNDEVSMAYACAIEMIHNYSLVHDDLPCMDDDDLRRGRPSTHKAFGYATALLAGDALLTRAFLTIAENKKASPEQNAKAVALLAKAAGDYGMIGGQVLDLQGETEEFDFDTLIKVQTMKTSALMECSARLGALAAGFDVDTKESEAAGVYGKNIGIAFQVVDDIIDVEGDQAEIGKNVRSDAEHNKTTFMTYYSAEDARMFAAELTAEAVSAISEFEGSETLTNLAAYLMQRNA